MVPGGLSLWELSTRADVTRKADSDFNKTLLDLEIYGLVRVSWVTKDKRRIELVADSGTASRKSGSRIARQVPARQISRQGMALSPYTPSRQILE